MANSEVSGKEKRCAHFEPACHCPEPAALAYALVVPLQSAFPNRLPSLRYVAVGATVNGLGYAAYLLLTWFGLSPQVAVTTLLLVSLLAAFQGHARFTFPIDRVTHGGLQAAVRYLLVTLTGYAMNLILLGVLVNRLGVPHQLAQLFAFAAVVPTMFVLLPYVVFRPAGRAP